MKTLYSQIVNTLKELGEYISIDFLVQQKSSKQKDTSNVCYLYSANGELSGDSSFEFHTTFGFAKDNLYYTSLEMFSWCKGELEKQLIENTLHNDNETIYIFNLYDCEYGTYNDITKIKTLEDFKNYLIGNLNIEDYEISIEDILKAE